MWPLGRRRAALVAAVERSPTPQAWAALLRAGGLAPRFVERLVADMRPAARAVPRSPGPGPGAGKAGSITSRLGGLPDVGPRFRWPTWEGEHLTFVGQLRLRELPASVRADLALPADGLLAFFYAAEEQPWGNEDSDAGGARVYFWPVEDLARARRPAEISRRRLLAPCGLRLVETRTIPDPWSWWAVVHDVGTRTLTAWMDAVAPWKAARRGPRHQVGGHVPRGQPGFMELDCALTAVGLDREHLDLRTRRARSAIDDVVHWTPLLQVDSDPRRGMVWGDAGALYFWMRRADLASLTMARAWCVLETT